MKKLFVLCAVMSLSSSLFADCGSDKCSDVLVEDIKMSASGDLIFTTSGDESRLPCDLVEGNAIRVVKTVPAFQEFYAMLISAQKSESMVNVRIDEFSESYQCELLELTANP